MPKVQLDGIEVYASWLTQRSYRAAYCEFLLSLTPKNKKAALAKFQRAGVFGKYSGLRVSGISDLSFLKDFPELLYLEVVDQKRVNTRHLDGLSNLRGLRLESPGAGIDFGCFPELEVFVGDWHVGNCNLQYARELRQIRIWHFDPQSADLSEFAPTTRLEWLEVVQTNIKSLGGLERLEDLRYLKVAYAPKLESLAALSNGELGIRELSIERANKIESYLPIASIPRLRRLQLSVCAPMENLEWTKGMDHLDMFSFVETNVKDGNLSPLLNLPQLQFVGTADKRHYSHKSRALNEILRQRHAHSV